MPPLANAANADRLEGGPVVSTRQPADAAVEAMLGAETCRGGLTSRARTGEADVAACCVYLHDAVGEPLAVAWACLTGGSPGTTSDAGSDADGARLRYIGFGEPF